MILGNRWIEVPLDHMVKKCVYSFSFLITVVYTEEKDSYTC